MTIKDRLAVLDGASYRYPLQDNLAFRLVGWMSRTTPRVLARRKHQRLGEDAGCCGCA